MSARNISANFVVNVSGIGYQMFDASGLIGSRITAGITNPTVGIYCKAGADDTGAIGVHWDNVDASATADEVFDAQQTAIKAAVVDSASVSGDTITLSNGLTQTVTAAGRVTA